MQNSKLSLKKKITKEIIDSLYSISKTTKMCDDFHKIAESNKLNILSKWISFITRIIITSVQ